MKIMSFNTQHCLNFIERKIDFEIMAKTIMEQGADIVGLNEMRGEGVDPDYTPQVDKLAELTGMPYFFFAPAIYVENKGLYGNGFLSRIPIIKAENIPIPDPQVKKHSCNYETRCILKAELEGGITVLVTHFGLNPDEQENAVKTVIENLADERCILMGDFNVTPDDPVLEPIRRRMRDTAELFGGKKLSFPSIEPKVKIDYIFLTPDLAVSSADIPCVVASDHFPHTATVEL